VKAGGGVVASIFSGMTAGWVAPEDVTDPEDVQSHLAAAMSMDGFSLPRSSAEARAHTLDAVRSAAPPSP
jgi:hypothetical protein